MKKVIVYANPLEEIGFAEEANVIEILEDCGKFKYCKVEMVSTRKICDVLIKI